VRRRTLVSVLAASILGCLSGGLGNPAQARPTGHSIGVFVPAGDRAQLPLHGGAVDSLNWSGYAVTGSGITAASSSFVVPSAGLVPPGFAATWTGIGGYNTSDLIQAGVGENSLPSNPLLGSQYYAWYELLPASETPITGCDGESTCPVWPGDNMSVSINRGSGSTWTIRIVDSGHWTWSHVVSYSSSESSAEWILEAPTLVAQTLLANVGRVAFGPTSTYTNAGGTHTIAQGHPTEIILSPGLIDEATPSALAANGQSFNDCAYSQTCPTP
jgi:hypothetical protein